MRKTLIQGDESPPGMELGINVCFVPVRQTMITSIFG